MTIRYTCPKCESTLKIKDELAGQPGKCPKCQSKFTIPAPTDASQSGTPAKGSGTGKKKEKKVLSEEEEIFGEDFFTADAASTKPRYTLSPADDDDSDDSEDVPVKPQKSKPTPMTAAYPNTTDNAANVASSLLSKTGKKNRPDQVEVDQNADPGYDFTEARYLIRTKIGPLVAVGLVLSIGMYYTMSSMFSNARELPPLAAFTGTVSVDGQAVEGARLDFILTGNDETPVSSYAITTAGGRFEARLGPDVVGAPVGTNTVRIMYGAVRDMQTIEVPQSGHTQDFQLTSAPAVER